MGKFLTEVPARDMSVFSFLDDNSMDFHQTWYVHCIDIVENCFKIANEQIVHF